ncbi:uncharacterized protein F4822DRAFT_273637 [Hypoxylon trugodes]|uniref:uncharacterized protein n=1 Tax=Hypoxylon trugodes TaxID=326681 RepID=UPI00218D66A4|nr:uncharacterized protein F4822DRAFT_273637 [Hypoxylon trugodes]KAI1382504.1 hypothetical protein F4822DRAFT_273637 [Hypoxylon trugodes]
MGQFALVLQSQQYTKGIADDGSDDNKVDFSPILTRSRALQSGSSISPQTPATPTPVRPSQAALARSPGGMDIDDLDEFSPSTSSVDQPSPMTGEAARQESKIKSEQEVVFSLVLLKRSVCNPYGQATRISWHPHQDVFVAKNRNGEKTFVAIVDTVMRVQDSMRSPSFGETKKVLRYAALNGAPIKAQEACQMAAKIAQHPPENLQEMRVKNLTARETWFAQDKNEVYIMVGTYKADYVDYISHRRAKLSFAEVQEYGPYTTDNWRLMEELGAIILAYALQQADAK